MTAQETARAVLRTADIEYGTREPEVLEALVDAFVSAGDISSSEIGAVYGWLDRLS